MRRTKPDPALDDRRADKREHNVSAYHGVGHAPRPGTDDETWPRTPAQPVTDPGPFDFWTIQPWENVRDWQGMDRPIAETCGHPDTDFEYRGGLDRSEWKPWKHRGGTDTPRPATPAEAERIGGRHANQ